MGDKNEKKGKKNKGNAGRNERVDNKGPEQEKNCK